MKKVFVIFVYNRNVALQVSAMVGSWSCSTAVWPTSLFCPGLCSIWCSPSAHSFPGPAATITGTQVKMETVTCLKVDLYNKTLTSVYCTDVIIASINTSVTFMSIKFHLVFYSINSGDLWETDLKNNGQNESRRGVLTFTHRLYISGQNIRFGEVLQCRTALNLLLSESQQGATRAVAKGVRLL